ncbi:hypothetical protein IG631_20868 [Alternaria alternata]|nr:hypothetical protein IG631_20868 [Alternaria alternata]
MTERWKGGIACGLGRASLAQRSTVVIHFLAAAGLDWMGDPCTTSVASYVKGSQVGMSDSGDCVG